MKKPLRQPRSDNCRSNTCRIAGTFLIGALVDLKKQQHLFKNYPKLFFLGFLFVLNQN